MRGAPIAIPRSVLAFLTLAATLTLTGTSTAQPPAEADSVMQTFPQSSPPPTSAPPDSATSNSTAPTSSPAVNSRVGRTGEEMDRIELGGAVLRGDFDWLATVAYRRFIREGGPFEQSMQLELAGTKKDQLTEGALSLYYFFRPMKSYKQGWKLRPLFEVGPGAHVVVQTADIEGFDDSAFHSQGYLKMHAYLGFEFLLGEKLGILARGRASVPEHHPFDYAQAAIFLR
jgi:hypothetical protein